MKILHVISSGGMYGAEAVILNLSRTLHEASHQSILAVFSNSAQPNLQLYEAAVKEGLEAHIIPCRGQIDRSVTTAIRKLALETSADVVHAHGYKADVYVYLALRGLRIPLVSTCHTWYDNDWMVRAYGALDRLILRRYASVVAVSGEVQQRLLHSGVPLQQIHLIRNGIDPRPFIEAQHEVASDDTDRPVRVGLVGRLSVEKGVDLFFQAAVQVLAECPHARFYVVGDGPDRSALESLLVQLDLKDRAFLLGRCDEMPQFYASLDLLVSSSRQEGLPMALLEGMASGLPLVASSVGAVPTLIQDGNTGALVPPEDIGALGRAIIGLLKDAARRKQYGAAARQLIADEFSAERMAVNYLHLYEKVTRTRATQAI